MQIENEIDKLMIEHRDKINQIKRREKKNIIVHMTYVITENIPQPAVF